MYFQMKNPKTGRFECFGCFGGLRAPNLANDNPDPPTQHNGFRLAGAAAGAAAVAAAAAPAKWLQAG